MSGMLFISVFSTPVCAAQGSSRTDAVSKSTAEQKALSADDLGVITISDDDKEKLAELPDGQIVKEFTDGNMMSTAVQGMAIDGDYLYVAKIESKKNNFANIYRYNLKTGGKLENVKYRESAQAEPLEYFKNIKHCNDMTIFDGQDGQKYMLTSNTTHLTDNNYNFHSMTVFKVDEKKAEMTLCGYVNLVRYKGKAGWVDCSSSSARYLGNRDDKDYFLMKNASDFYWFALPEDYYGDPKYNRTAAEASAAEEDKIRCHRIFTIDNRNMPLRDEESGRIKTVPNLETWTNQGFNYNPEEDAIYVPLYDQYTSKASKADNVIAVYSLNGLADIKKLEEKDKEEDVTGPPAVTLYPSTLGFRFKTGVNFEVESCGFTEDGSFYMVTNASPSGNEAIWKIDYKSGEAKNLQSIMDLTKVHYTIEYDANADGVSKDGNTAGKTAQFKMSIPTMHMNGVPTNLRPNMFENKKDNKTVPFEGWYLYRKSDKKWSCEDGWFSSDKLKGKTLKLYQDREEVDYLTDVDGDVITAQAQWGEVKK